MQALTSLGLKDPHLTMITPMEAFNVIWFKLPLLVRDFYRVAMDSLPGLGLYRAGTVPSRTSLGGSVYSLLGGTVHPRGVFAYFVVFRFGLTFLLSIGQGNYVIPMVTISNYFELFVNVVLGVGLVFELPVIIFFLTLIRILNPAFLVRHSRYAILAIFVLAAIITPTPDVFNLMLFATPMCLFFYVGVFASYLLVLHRENRRFPWKTVGMIVIAVLLLLSAVIYLAITNTATKWYRHGPFSCIKGSEFVETNRASGVPSVDCAAMVYRTGPSMDLYKAIQDLYAEKEKLERVIASLEELQRTANPAQSPASGGKRRGRKSMNAKERQDVSARMKKYWESRRRRPIRSPRGSLKPTARALGTEAAAFILVYSQYLLKLNGRVAQLGEHGVRNAGVVGSNPISSTIPS